MSSRGRWTVVGGALLVLLGFVALLVLNYPQEQRGPKTWIVEPGETLTLSADETVYAVFVYQGRNAVTAVSLHPDTFTARVVLDQDGNKLAVVSWATGTKPFPAQVFGPKFDVAPE